MQPFITRIRTNLNGVLQMTKMIDGIMMTGDNLANQIIVELHRDRTKVEIQPGTTIVGYFIRADGYTLEVFGDVTENGEARVNVPAAAYYVSGVLSIAVRMIENDTKIVIATASCFVQITETDSIIDPDHKIPDVQDVIAKLEEIDAKEEAIEDAEELRVSAETTRESAETARVAAEAARVTAETSRVSAETLRNTAEQQRIANEAARVSAETARASAETARNSAEDTRTANDLARQTALQNMSVEAIQLEPYSTPTVTITNVNGHKHITFGMAPGNPFIIRKTFSSVSEMESYSGTDVKVYDFVMITSTTQDPDNAKLYMKTSTGWFFVTDLSGAQGIQGPQGIQGNAGNGISSIVLNQNYTLTVNYTDGTSYTTPTSIRGKTGATGSTGPQGIQGETGNGISSITRNQDYTLTITMTNGTSYTTDVPIRGERGATGPTGATGPGITSVAVNSDYTMTYNLDNGTSYTTPFSMRGPQGEPGQGGTVFNYNSTTNELTITFG